MRKARTKSIKARMVWSFLIVIFIAILAFEIILIYFTRFYFYSSVDNLLTNQIKTSAEFYNRYFSNVPLEANVADNTDVFWRQTNAQVQIFNNLGTVLMDSSGGSHQKPLSTSDVKQALSGEKGLWIGKNDGSNEHVLSVSYPLRSNDDVVGGIRYITSLKELDNSLVSLSAVFIAIGVGVLLITSIISIFVANSIINPVKKVTNAALQMSKGNLDITVEKVRNDEVGTLSDTLNHMAREIKKRDDIKNEFISMVSHELRTPLTAIKGWATTMADDVEDKEVVNDGLSIIIKESERLSRMVEELLDFSRFTSGKVELNMELTDMDELIDYVAKHMSTRADNENIEFVVTHGNLPCIILDKDKIKQVIINLLANAFKFTPNGGRVELIAAEQKNFLVITVIDTGVGIAKEELSRVKERFYKGKSSKSQTGLGLSICDEIIKLHGGSLELESEINEGTRAVVALPVTGARKANGK